MANKVVGFRPTDEDLALLEEYQSRHPGLSQTELWRLMLREALSTYKGPTGVNKLTASGDPPLKEPARGRPGAPIDRGPPEVNKLTIVDKSIEDYLASI